MPDTLLRTQQVLCRKLEGLDRAEAPDGAALRRLQEMVRSLREQAHSRLVMICFRDIPECLEESAEQVLDFCQYAEERLEILCKASRL